MSLFQKPRSKQFLQMEAASSVSTTNNQQQVFLGRGIIPSVDKSKSLMSVGPLALPVLTGVNGGDSFSAFAYNNESDANGPVQLVHDKNERFLLKKYARFV